MTQQLELNNYKQRIADLYNRRSHNYDDGEWRLKVCYRLLEYSQIGSGQDILDIGTGTGNLAIAASQLVGDGGKVTGVDIAAKILGRKAKNAEIH